MMLLMVAVLLTDVCTVGSNGEPLNVQYMSWGLQCTLIVVCISACAWAVLGGNLLIGSMDCWFGST